MATTGPEEFIGPGLSRGHDFLLGDVFPWHETFGEPTVVSANDPKRTSANLGCLSYVFSSGTPKPEKHQCNRAKYCRRQPFSYLGCHVAVMDRPSEKDKKIYRQIPGLLDFALF